LKYTDASNPVFEEDSIEFEPRNSLYGLTITEKVDCARALL